MRQVTQTIVASMCHMVVTSCRLQLQQRWPHVWCVTRPRPTIMKDYSTR